MATLYTMLSSKISKNYHKRLEEILYVLDSSVEYTWKCTRNVSGFRYNLDLCLKDRDGYELIDSTVLTYNGFVNLYPRRRVDGDFIFTVVKSRLLNPISKTTKEEHTILIYEQDERNKNRYRGVS